MGSCRRGGDLDETEWPKLTADARTLDGLELVRTEISAPLEIDVAVIKSLSDDWYADHLCNATDGGMASYGLTGTSQIGAYEGRPCVTVNAKGSDVRGSRPVLLLFLVRGRVPRRSFSPRHGSQRPTARFLDRRGFETDEPTRVRTTCTARSPAHTLRERIFELVVDGRVGVNVWSDVVVGVLYRGFSNWHRNRAHAAYLSDHRGLARTREVRKQRRDITVRRRFLCPLERRQARLVDEVRQEQFGRCFGKGKMSGLAM